MVIGGEGVGKFEIGHDFEGNAIRQKPFLIGPFGEQIEPALKLRCRSGDDDGLRNAAEYLQFAQEDSPVGRLGVEIRDFDQDEVGRHDCARELRRKRRHTRM
jgi:hypothetical protein